MLPPPVARWFSRAIGFPLVIYGGWRRDKDRRGFSRLVGEKLDTHYWPPERVEAARMQLLRALLEHAGQQVPYYRDLFRQIGFDPRGVRSLGDLEALPRLTRPIMQAEGARMLAEDVPVTARIVGRTGGTTGVPLAFWQDRNFGKHNESAAWMSDMIAGRRYGSPTVYVVGAPFDHQPYAGWLGLARKWLRNENLYSSRVMSDDAWLRLHHTLEARPPDILVAFASAAADMARVLARAGLTPRYPRVAVIPTGEALEPEMRRDLERVFPAPVFNRYGSREAGLIACECEAHAGLHLNQADIYVESIGADVYSEPGELLITQLRNYAMPFIRYQIDDLAVLARGPCSCGRTSPMLLRVAGRKTPIFTTASGDYVESIRLTAAVRMVPGVRQFQLIEEAVGRLRLLVAPGPGCAPDGFAVARADIAEIMGRAASWLSTSSTNCRCRHPASCKWRCQGCRRTGWQEERRDTRRSGPLVFALNRLSAHHQWRLAARQRPQRV
jgi:phenylacetate-CoA ligase